MQIEAKKLLCHKGANKGNSIIQLLQSELKAQTCSNSIPCGTDDVVPPIVIYMKNLYSTKYFSAIELYYNRSVMVQE